MTYEKTSTLERQTSQELKGKKSRFNLLTTSELMNLPPTQWRIRHVLPDAGLVAVYGPSGSGKTFLVLDIAHAVKTGREWFGHRIKPCPVIYIALEGEGGISKRVKAITQQHGESGFDIRYLVQPFTLLGVGMVKELAQTIHAEECAGGVVIIDTLNRAAPNCDENSSEDMGNVISASKRLQEQIGGLVILVHHTGKDATKGMRGHSSLIAALDVAIEVSRNGDAREWRLAKSKDGDDGNAHPFRLEVVKVGQDDDGEPVTSCVVAEDHGAETIKRAKLPQGGTQRIVYDAMDDLLRSSRDFGKAGAPIGRPCLELEAAILSISDKLSCRKDQRNHQSRRAITAMQSKGIFKVNEGWLWLP